MHFKQRVLGFVECRTPAIYHATTTVLNQLDRTQDNFFRELGIDSTAALMDFNLAPLSMRRDIALGYYIVLPLARARRSSENTFEGRRVACAWLILLRTRPYLH